MPTKKRKNTVTERASKREQIDVNVDALEARISILEQSMGEMSLILAKLREEYRSYLANCIDELMQPGVLLQFSKPSLPNLFGNSLATPNDPLFVNSEPSELIDPEIPFAEEISPSSYKVGLNSFK